MDTAIAEITEHNFIRIFTGYMNALYGHLIDASRDECPYARDFDDDHYTLQQTAIWFACERRNPETGTTLLEEFVDQFVREPGLASMILQMGNLVHDRFTILDAHGGVITVKAWKGGGTYRIRLYPETDYLFTEGRSFAALICPWYQDGTHMICGDAAMPEHGDEPLSKWSILDPTSKIVERFRQYRREKGDSIVVSPFERYCPRDTDDDHDTIHLLIEYVGREYGSELADCYDQCPYSMDFEDSLKYKQAVIWFAFDRIDPRTGVTILDEFVDRFVEDEGLAAKLLQSKLLFYGDFEVLDKDDRNIVTMRDEKSGRTYRVMVTEKTASRLTRGSHILGRIHPWHADGTHKTCGIVNIAIMNDAGTISGLSEKSLNKLRHMLQRDAVRKLKKIESVQLALGTGLSHILRQYPSDWLKRICKSLRLDSARATKQKRIEAIRSALTTDRLLHVVDGLSGDELACLRYVAGCDGITRYGNLQRRFGNDDTDWSNKPRSPVGRLRMKGLLLIGLHRKGTKNYKVAAIAPEVLANLIKLDCLKLGS